MAINMFPQMSYGEVQSSNIGSTTINKSESKDKKKKKEPEEQEPSEVRGTESGAYDGLEFDAGGYE